MLVAAARGEKRAAEELLPLVYAELRRLAEARMAKTPPGGTLQPTALVHEAYLRLVGSGDPGWKGRHHFFGAAAQAMRDILVEQARRKARLKRGGDRKRVDIDPANFAGEPQAEEIVAVDEALKRLEQQDARSAEIVLLRYFAGLTEAEIAAALDLSERTVRRDWRYARSWLQRELSRTD
ncbi:MAG: sigma-70 family RNA polymerase sigma factor [bacterium]|nr:sigma-70 family RNA polymerase sigma factor [bacterium]